MPIIPPLGSSAAIDSPSTSPLHRPQPTVECKQQQPHYFWTRDFRGLGPDDGQYNAGGVNWPTSAPGEIAALPLGTPSPHPTTRRYSSMHSLTRMQ